MQNKKIIIDDTTLRDGEQSAGVAFSLEEKLAIAQHLDSIGVPELEIGIPSMGTKEYESIQEITKLNLNAHLVIWSRMRSDDLKCCRGLKVQMIDLSMPISDIQISRKLGKTRDWVLQEIDWQVKSALNEGFEVCVGGEDASRADPDFLCQVSETAQQAGASRFRFADTLGIMEPFGIRSRFEQLRQAVDLDLEIHAHDDLGLATANTLAAILGGATHANTTVHGLGERAGNAALEEVVMGLRHLHQIDTGVDLKHYQQLSTLVASAAQRPVGWHKSLVGDGVFTHEAGIHVDGLLKYLQNYQGVDPAEMGRSHQLVLGKHSGTHGVIHAYQALGLTLDRVTAERLLSRIRHFAETTKKAPNTMDLLNFYRARI